MTTKILLVLAFVLTACVCFGQGEPTNNGGNGYALDKDSKIVLRAITIPLRDNFTSGTEYSSTQYVLPANCVVIDAYVHVKSSTTTSTLNVGTLSSDSGGDADGFLSAVNLSAPGTKRTTLGALLTGTGRYINGTASRRVSWTFSEDFTNKIDGNIHLVIYEVK